MTDAVHDAVLDDWSPCVTRFPDLNFVVGDVRSDRKGRFTDGEMITTSMLVTPIDELREGVFARTRNSVYLLGRRAEKVSMQAFLYAGSLQGRVLDAQGRPVDTMSMAECDADGTSTSEKRNSTMDTAEAAIAALGRMSRHDVSDATAIPDPQIRGVWLVTHGAGRSIVYLEREDFEDVD